MAPSRTKKNPRRGADDYLRPASQVAKRSQVEFSFHREVTRKPTYVEREFFFYFRSLDLFSMLMLLPTERCFGLPFKLHRGDVTAPERTHN